MKKNWNKDSFLLFTKVGAIICTSLAILSLSLKAYPETAETLSASIAGKKELPIYCVEKEKPQISLSFDAAWGNQDTRKILEVLKKNNVKVTFFMTGGWIEKYPEDVKAIAKDGHDLGNHSENHKQMSRLTANECMEEIMKPHQKVKALTGKDMILFRPPYGDYNNTLIQTLKGCNYYGIQWDVDSLDWKLQNKEQVLSCLSGQVKEGDVILMHDGYRSSVDAAFALVDHLQKQGFVFVNVEEMILE